MATDDRPYADILAADDWRPMSEYVPSAEYVYAKGYAYRAAYPYVAVARQGRGTQTWRWYTPSGQVLEGVVSWRPLPNGMCVYELERSLYGDVRSGAYVRPPEPVYAPGGTDVRLTPVPRDLLVAMRDGAWLTERAWRWTVWQLQMPSEEPKKIGDRAVDGLRRHAFIARAGVLPPGRLPHWHHFDWSITDAGKAWLAAWVERARELGKLIE